MNSHELHAAGLLDDRQAVIAAMMSDGWTADDAIELLDGIINPEPARQQFRRYSREQEATLQAVIDRCNGKMPSQAVIRGVAATLGRTPKSVLSKMERMVGGYDRTTP